MADRLPPASIELSAKVESLVPGTPWRLVWSRVGHTKTETFSAVLLALPASALAALPFGALAERPLASLESIEYSAVSSLFLGFRREQIAHPLDGFGALMPAVEKSKMLGVLFSSSLFPDRAPAGHAALTVMVGGARHPELSGKPIDEIFAAVRPELERLLGLKGDPVFRRVRHWPRAIPQYQLGYERYLEVMANCESAYSNLFIGGHVRDGIALPACILSGFALATRATRSL
jgi:oxygen-dependent protoporphyrinogen oxidase